MRVFAAYYILADENEESESRLPLVLTRLATLFLSSVTALDVDPRCPAIGCAGSSDESVTVNRSLESEL